MGDVRVRMLAARALLVAVVVLPFLLGWVAAVTVRAAVAAGTWTRAAVVTGWRAGRGLDEAGA